MHRFFEYGAACAALAGVVAAPRIAHAANCADLPNPVFVEAGDTQEPLLKALGRALRDAGTPMTIVYKTNQSCNLINDMYTATPVTDATLKYAPSKAEAATWDPAKDAPSTCTNTSTALDVAISALFVSSCTTTAPPAPLGLVTGPIQAYTFVVPEKSSQTAITAEEGYFAFGFGVDGKIQPWNDPNFFFIRPATASTILTLGAAIGVPAAKWKAPDANRLPKSTDVLTKLADPAIDAEKTIAILGAEIYDQHRDIANALAFRAYHQRRAYYADSSATAFDKRNVRDGHYFPSSPTVYITPVDAQNVPTKPNVKRLVDLVLGQSAPADVDGLTTVINKGLIPDCAMKVKRSYDGGDFSLYSPAEPCGCYFESKAGPGNPAPPGCNACTDDSTCNGGKCRHGFCEVK